MFPHSPSIDLEALILFSENVGDIPTSRGHSPSTWIALANVYENKSHDVSARSTAILSLKRSIRTAKVMGSSVSFLDAVIGLDLWS